MKEIINKIQNRLYVLRVDLNREQACEEMSKDPYIKGLCGGRISQARTELNFLKELIVELGFKLSIHYIIEENKDDTSSK